MKLLIIGRVNSGNIGDRAIYLTLKNLFESQGHKVSGLDMSRMNQFCITGNEMERILANDLYWDEEHSLQAMKREEKVSFRSRLISMVFRMPNFVAKALYLCLKKLCYWKHKREWSQIVKGHDLVIFGGGSLLMDNSWNFPLALVCASRLVKNLGVPYGCVGCSVGETFSRNGARWLTKFLEGSSFIILRDPISGIYLQKLGTFQYEVYIDSTICTKEIISFERATLKGIIGINILSYVYFSQITRCNYQRYIKVMRNLIMRIDEMPHLGFKQVILFNAGESDDMYASQALYSQVRGKLNNLNIRVCKKMRNLEELSYVVSQCDVVIGTRLHSSIISKSFGIPIIGIAWAKKVAGFYEMINLKQYCFDYKTFNAEMLVSAIKSIKSNDFCQKAEVEEHVRKLRKLPKYITQKTGIKE